jgi:mersacidin/lichenicidin family type 2 lantibiotic
MLNDIDIERAYKDADYRQSLTPAQLAQLPTNPAGDEELSEQELDETAGGLLAANPSGGITSAQTSVQTPGTSVIVGGKKNQSVKIG